MAKLASECSKRDFNQHYEHMMTQKAKYTHYPCRIIHIKQPNVFCEDRIYHELSIKPVTPEEKSDARVCTHCRREFADVLSSCCLCSSQTLNTLFTHTLTHSHNLSLTQTLTAVSDSQLCERTPAAGAESTSAATPTSMTRPDPLSACL